MNSRLSHQNPSQEYHHTIQQLTFLLRSVHQTGTPGSQMMQGATRTA